MVRLPFQPEDWFQKLMETLCKCDLPKTKTLLMEAQRKAQEKREQKDEEKRMGWEKDKARSDMDLRGVNLEQADICQLDLRKADCRGANFQ